MIWRELTELLPDATFIYVRRNFSDSKRSLATVGGVASWQLDERYDQLSQKASDFFHTTRPRVIEFHDLQEPHWLRKLWEWVAGDSPLPEEHLRKMMTLRVTQKDEIIQAAANSPQTKGAFKW